MMSVPPRDDVGGLRIACDDYSRARSRADHAGAAQAIGTALDLVYRADGAGSAIDPWIDALDELVADGYPALPPDIEAQVLAGALAVLGRRPDHPLLPLWAAQGQRLLASPQPAAVVVPAARFVFEYAVRAGNFALAADIVALAEAQLPIHAASRRQLIEWHESRALLHWLRAEHDDALAAVSRALTIAGTQDVGDPAALRPLHEQAASAALSAGDLDTADRHLALLRVRSARMRAQDVAHAHFLMAGRATLGGDDDAAERRIAACLRTPQEATPRFFSTLWTLGRAHIRIVRGDARRAERDLALVLAQASSLFWCYLEFSALLHRAWLRIRQGEAAPAADALRVALDLQARHGYRNCDPWWNPRMMEDLSTAADAEPALSPRLAAFAARGAAGTRSR